MDIDAAKFKVIHNSNIVKHEIVLHDKRETSPGSHEHDHSPHTPEDELDIKNKSNPDRTAGVYSKKNKPTVVIVESEGKPQSSNILKRFAKMKKLVLPLLFTAITFQEFGIPLLGDEHKQVHTHSAQQKNHISATSENQGVSSYQEEWNII